MGKRVTTFFLFMIITMFSIQFITAWDSDLNDGLIFYLDHNQGQGTNIEDVYRGIHNATISGTVWNTTSAILGNSTTYDGNDETQISYSAEFDLTGNITICSWFKPVIDASYRTIFDRDYGNGGSQQFMLRKSNANKFQGRIYAGSATTLTGTTTLTSNWHLGCIMYNGTTFSIWLNGTQENQVAETDTLGYNGNDDLDIGWWDDNIAGNYYYKGEIDETMFWNKSLTATQLNYLWNNSQAVVFNSTSTSSQLNITLLSPINNDEYQTHDIIFNFSIIDSGALGITNATLYVYDSGGELVFNETNTSKFEGNYYIDTSLSDGDYTWNVTVFDDTGGNITSTTAQFSIDTKVRLRIVDTNQDLITDAVMTIDGGLHNSNTRTYGENTSTTMVGQTLQIYAYSLSSSYTPNTTNITIVSGTKDYNITLSGFTLSLNFTQSGGIINVSGYITDLNRSITFSNISYLKNQIDFQQDLVYIRFLNSIYDENSSWADNKTQFYEYTNNPRYTITEEIEIFENIDTSSYFQTQDNSGNIIKGATMRIYGAIPSNLTEEESVFAFFGQRITDDEGKTVFPMDSNMEIYLVTTATGYQTRTTRLTASEITTFTADDPKLIRLERSPYTVQQNVFLGGLYKIDGSRVYESKFDNLTSDYAIFVYDYYERDLLYSTSFEGLNRSISIDSTRKTGVISLESGEQFSNSSNATWYLYIHADNELIYTISFVYDLDPQELILDIDTLGLRNSDAWKTIVFIIIIIVGSISGLLFKTAEGDSGVHAFFIAGFVGTTAVAGLGWLSLTGVFFYFSKMVKKWYSE